MRRLLLDTHVLLWWLSDDRRLGRTTKALLADTASRLWLSAASVWEISTKYYLGRLTLHAPPDEIIEHSTEVYRLHRMDITPAHALAAGALPHHHRDPFDRMLVAQALAERLSLVTSDPALAAYDLDHVNAEE